MRLKSLINKIIYSDKYKILKSLITLGGNSKFAPAALTFFVMISLVPVLTMIVILLSLFGYNITNLLEYIQNNFSLSENTMTILEQYFLNVPNYNKIIFGVGIFILIYISSKGMSFFTYAYQKINNSV